MKHSPIIAATTVGQLHDDGSATLIDAIVELLVIQIKGTATTAM